MGGVVTRGQLLHLGTVAYQALPITPKRVLVVDDDTAIRRTLKRALVLRGHTPRKPPTAIRPCRFYSTKDVDTTRY